MNILIQILSVVAFAIIVLVIYNVLKAYVLDKLNINKWIVLLLAIAIYVVPVLIWPNIINHATYYVMTGISAIMILWFTDLSGFLKNSNIFKKNSTSIGSANINAKKDKKDDVVIRSKAKPNRNKNNKK
ncbi:hypothetical protein K2F40_07635 [Clostridium sp. CM028]|uniref:hypothetical protein n=1 Tax=unclassified Clostridium TaxID=2614128 RepID=UPI001C0CA676|nr:MULTISPECIES: hypothetical protein [unclassified Clostridium]MBU3091859.1 hypothetical protein [Clostridium sp. CF011]MBW9145355.1 hypothetical protein [Clostridium sp. CM027]MBW9148830.1 hypothetical protein [Clostridium sp. CM028]UVE42493.1 hypothetical protein KTC92_08715 [Clostridium sp. CM027]WAG71513.1 hypothetical protein LL036_08955 [Clostridium sp. CF011]